MPDPHDAAPGRTTYQLRVAGRLDELAFDDIDHLTLALTCELPDQEALVRLVTLLHDFGLPLVSAERPGARP